MVCVRPLGESEIFWTAKKRNLMVFKTLGKLPLGRARRNLEVNIAMGLEKLDREYRTKVNIKMSRGSVPRRGSFCAVLHFGRLLMLLE